MKLLHNDGYAIKKACYVYSYEPDLNNLHYFCVLAYTFTPREYFVSIFTPLPVHSGH